MESLSRIIAILSRWIDEVAETVLAGIEEFRAPARLRLVEREDDCFVCDDAPAGDSGDRPAVAFRLGPAPLSAEEEDLLKAAIQKARVEVLLRPGKFLFRPLELPARAGEFLDGIIRAQIDRLTPWNAANALFGWTLPAETSGGRMTITVAATGRSLIRPLTDLLSDLGAASISLSVASPEPGGQPIVISDQKTRTAREIERARLVLLYALGGLGGLAAVSILAAVIGGSDLEARQQEVEAEIAAIRGSLRARNDPSSDAVAALQQRKQATPSCVLVLDAVSEILPDHTFLSELRVEDGKVEIIGLTKDAPSLIALIERSPRFREASFVAPTTRSLAKPGDNFHIEAYIRPPRHGDP